MRTQKQFIGLSGKWLCQHFFWETWISADFAQLDKIFVSKGYTMSFSPAYAKRTCWPRAEALTVMFYWVNVQRSRLCPSKEMCIQGKSFWVMSQVGLPGLISAYELAYQSGSQNRKCHLRSAGELDVHESLDCEDCEFWQKLFHLGHGTLSSSAQWWTGYWSKQVTARGNSARRSDRSIVLSIAYKVLQYPWWTKI